MYFFTYFVEFFNGCKGDFGEMDSAKGIVVGSSWSEVLNRVESYYGKDTIMKFSAEMVDYDTPDMLPEEVFPETFKNLRHEMRHIPAF